MSSEAAQAIQFINVIAKCVRVSLGGRGCVLQCASTPASAGRFLCFANGLSLLHINAAADEPRRIMNAKDNQVIK